MLTRPRAGLLLVDQFSDIGGGQQCFLDLFPALHLRGWKVEAAIPGAGAFRERLECAGVPVHAIPCGPYRSGAKTPRDMTRFAADVVEQKRILSSLIGSGRFGMVYVNGPRVAVAAAWSSGRIPLVYHAHLDIGRGPAFHSAALSLRWRKAWAVACCRFVAKPLERYIQFRRLRVIPTGVRDHATARGDAGGEFAVGAIGRIEPQKGQLETLGALDVLSRSGIHVRSLVCGAANPMYPEYEAKVRALGQALRTEFVAWTDEIREVLGRIDLLVIASAKEAFPRVMVEAFSAGVPVLAFSSGGIPEAIEDGVTGFLVRKRSAGALAARIEACLRDPIQLRTVARNARVAWEREYRAAIYRKRVVELLDEAAAESSW